MEEERSYVDEMAAMSGNHPAQQEGAPRSLHILGLTVSAICFAALAVATFVLSYKGVRAFALQAGVQQGYARDYPLLIDAMLVIVMAAVPGLRRAGAPARLLSWLTLLGLLGAAGGADFLHATGRRLPHNVAATIVAVLPWALVFVAFVLLLSMLRLARRRHRDTQRLRAWYASAVPAVTLDPDVFTVPPPPADLPVRTPQPWQSPSIVPGFSPGLVPSASAGALAGAAADLQPLAAPSVGPADEAEPVQEPAAAAPQRPAATLEAAPTVAQPVAGMPKPPAAGGGFGGQDPQQSGDVLTSGSGYAGIPDTDEPTETAAASGPAEQTDDEQANAQRHFLARGGQAAMAGLRSARLPRGGGAAAAEEEPTADDAPESPDNTEGPAPAADLPAPATVEAAASGLAEQADGEQANAQRHFLARGGQAAMAGLRSARLWRGGGAAAAEEEPTAEDAPGDAESADQADGEQATGQRHLLARGSQAAMAGLRSARLWRSGAAVAEQEPSAATDQAPGDADEGIPAIDRAPADQEPTAAADYTPAGAGGELAGQMAEPTAATDQEGGPAAEAETVTDRSAAAEADPANDQAAAAEDATTGEADTPAEDDDENPAPGEGVGQSEVAER